MSTQRSTRSASRVSSSKAVSPPISEQDIPNTPSAAGRRSTRKPTADAALPAVNLRTSTAYGTNSTTQPTFMKGPETHDQINNVLVGILEPVQEEATPSNTGARRGRPAGSRGRGRTRKGSTVPPPPSIDRSFAHESAIFGTAGLESSSFAADSEFEIISEYPSAEEPVLESVELQNQRPLITEIARNTRVERPPKENPVPAAVPRSPLRFLSHASGFLSDVLSFIGEILSTIFSRVMLISGWIRDVIFSSQGKTAMIVIAVIVALFGVISQIDLQRPIRWYGTLDISHNIGQFIPYSVSHPLSVFKDGDIRDLEKRLTAAEYDIAHLQTRTSVDRDAISHLEKILPDTIVCQRDEHGHLQIPNNFWHALRDKIRSDNSLLEERFAKAESGSTSSSGLSKKEIIGIAQKQVEQTVDRLSTKSWEKFLDTNRAQIMAWSGEEIDKQTASLRNDVLASKSDFMAMIEQNWADTKEAILNELTPHQKTLELIRSRISKLEKQAIGATRDEIRAIAADVSKNVIFSAQFAPLAEAHLKGSAKLGLLRVNHFSPGTGAVVNAHLTSSNFVFPSMRLNMMSKFLSWVSFRPIRSPNPPESALTKWDEHGDCWCSPLSSKDGIWPTLAVIISNKIYPDQIIVEHIPTTASLEPGSAPQEMELWVYIEDRAIRETVESRSMDFFQEEKQPNGMVKIGTWTYDTESTQHIQSFPLQIDLTLFGDRAYTNNLMVRVKTNWGGNRVNYACLYRVRVNGKIAEPGAKSDHTI